jgi:K+-sensing histidine kinase KdpD
MKAESKPAIIVCLDTSNNSTTVLHYACQIAKKSGFVVQIVVVIESSKGLLFASKTIEKEKRMQVEKKLKKLIDIVAKETGIMPTISIREGDVVREIAKEIKASEAAVMLVLGKSYNAQSDNNVLPKLTAQIGNKIQIPVVIVPENLDEQYVSQLFKKCEIKCPS